ncbi:unnamed protein product [Brachionus calyciflorus]|uniref:Uncharacterized protein n=1 Tax=Brachionus calyciflorus TaxID=104777 RepID=A0A814FH97_9BILA|nr:unnamed protein product [Brachionus calyciflorus]
MLSKQQAILSKIQNENSKIMNKIDQLEKNLHVVYNQQQNGQQNCTPNNETNISVNPMQGDNKEINENSTDVSKGELQGKKTYSSKDIKIFCYLS